VWLGLNRFPARDLRSIREELVDLLKGYLLGEVPGVAGTVGSVTSAFPAWTLPAASCLTPLVSAVFCHRAWHTVGTQTCFLELGHSVLGPSTLSSVSRLLLGAVDPNQQTPDRLAFHFQPLSPKPYKWSSWETGPSGSGR
jgi:hypothetical protein